MTNAASAAEGVKLWLTKSPIAASHAEHVLESAQLAQSAREISTQSILIHASAAEHAQAYAHRVLSKRSENKHYL